MAGENFGIPFDEFAINHLKKSLRGEVDKAARIAVRMGILEHTWHMVHRTGDPIEPALEKLKDIEAWVMGDEQPKDVVVKKGDALEGVPCTE